jgi:tripartite-type tricarboxylate transporter receptor subunit TctC
MLAEPEIRARISREGADAVGSTPDAFAQRVKDEIAKWSKVIKQAGITTLN